MIHGELSINSLTYKTTKFTLLEMPWSWNINQHAYLIYLNNYPK